MINQLKKIASSANCRVGKKYPVLEIERVSENEYTVNGYSIFMHMDGNWSSNPVITDIALKNRIAVLLQKMKRCVSGVLCNPTAEFGMIEKCKNCKKLL